MGLWGSEFVADLGCVDIDYDWFVFYVGWLDWAVFEFAEGLVFCEFFFEFLVGRLEVCCVCD